MLSRGDELPESICKGNRIKTVSIPNWGMDLPAVAINIPFDVAARR